MIRLARLLVLALLAGPSLAQEPSAAPARITVADNKLVVPGAPIGFAPGGAVLTPESDAALSAVATWLAEKDYVSFLRVEAHTDADGDDAANQALTDARAVAVTKALVAKGVDCKRLLPVGFGENKPLAANDTAEGKATNRRVELHVAMIKGRAVGGMPVDGGGHVAGDACK